jgi:hypothetical protein
MSVEAAPVGGIRVSDGSKDCVDVAWDDESGLLLEVGEYESEEEDDDVRLGIGKEGIVCDAGV